MSQPRKKTPAKLGRPVVIEGRVRVTISLSTEQAGKLDRYALDHDLLFGGGPCKSEAVRHMIDRLVRS